MRKKLDPKEELVSFANRLNKTAAGVLASGERAVSAAKNSVSDTVDTVTGKFKGITFFSSIETLPPGGQRQFDEKHYFLVPFKLEAKGYIIHSLRTLPDGVPPINDLPKRRIFHLPTLEHKKTLEVLVSDQVEEDIKAGRLDRSRGSLVVTANALDKVDSKLTNGLMLVGGIVAIANPLAGAAIAGNALLAKAGLKWTGKKLNEAGLEREIEKAKQNILTQFESSDTVCMKNPLLRELERALSTTKEEHDPMAFDLQSASFSLGNTERNIALTARAILDVYAEVRQKKKLQALLNVGPEDIAWFDYLEQAHRLYERTMNSPKLNAWRYWCEQLALALSDRGDGDLLGKLGLLNEHIHTLAPLIARRATIDNDRYDIERIYFNVLPELFERYLAFPVEALDESLSHNVKTPRDSFRQSFKMLYGEVDNLVKKVYEGDAREIHLLSQHLRETYTPSMISIDK